MTRPARSPAAMTARAVLSTVQRSDRYGNSISRVDVLRSKTPLILRPTRPKGPEPLVRHATDIARVALASGAAGPLGGDRFELDVHVGAGSTLLLSEISATLLLPGAHGGRSHMRIRITVDDDATLVWLPEPVIAAQGCDHRHDIDIELAPQARLLMRDALLLGRHREQPGDLDQRIRIRHNGQPLHYQRLRLGPSTRGWASPAVLGANKCVGTVLVVDPAWADDTPSSQLFATDAALMPLAGSAAMISALADDSLSLRRKLDQGISLLGEPWTPATNLTAPGAPATTSLTRAPAI